MNIEKLTELGLTEKEAAVYIACLELGSSKVSTIAKKAKVVRDSCYFLLSELVKKKLVREDKSMQVKKYFPENPANLITYFEEQEKEVLKKKQIAEKVCGELRPLFHRDRDFQVVLIDGDDSPGLLGNEIAKSGALVRSFSTHSMLEAYPKKKNDHRNKFRNHPKPIITIANSEHLTGYHKNGAIHSYFIPKGKYNFNGEMAIYEDKVVFSRKKIPYKALLIRDGDISNLLKVLFDIALEQVKTIITRQKDSDSQLQ